jgi:hypothetical protein
VNRFETNAGKRRSCPFDKAVVRAASFGQASNEKGYSNVAVSFLQHEWFQHEALHSLQPYMVCRLSQPARKGAALPSAGDGIESMPVLRKAGHDPDGRLTARRF